MKKYFLTVSLFLTSCGLWPHSNQQNVNLFTEGMEIISIEKAYRISIEAPIKYKYILRLNADGFDVFYYTNDNTLKIGDTLFLTKK